MSEVEIAYRFRVRRRTAASWASLNEPLLDSEIGLESDTVWPNGGGRKFKIGPGAWNSLPYAVPDTPNAGGLVLVGTATVTGSAATTLTLSGLDLATDKCYRIMFACKNATASASNVNLYYSGDTTSGNYYRQTIQFNDTTVSGARNNNGFGFSMVASGPATGDMEILLDFDGRARAFIRNSLSTASTIQIHDVRHVRNVVGNVTSITFSASVANSLAVGSYFKVYKVN